MLAGQTFINSVQPVDLSHSLLLALEHSSLHSEILGVRTNDRTDGHEQGEGGSRAHDVVTQGSHDTVRTSPVLEDGEPAKQDTYTNTDGTTHDSTHLEFVKVRRLVVLNSHYK